MPLIRAISVDGDLGGVGSENMEIAHRGNFDMFDYEDEEKIGY